MWLGFAGRGAVVRGGFAGHSGFAALACALSLLSGCQQIAAFVAGEATDAGVVDVAADVAGDAMVRDGRQDPLEGGPSDASERGALDLDAAVDAASPSCLPTQEITTLKSGQLVDLTLSSNGTPHLFHVNTANALVEHTAAAGSPLAQQPASPSKSFGGDKVMRVGVADSGKLFVLAHSDLEARLETLGFSGWEQSITLASTVVRGVGLTMLGSVANTVVAHAAANIADTDVVRFSTAGGTGLVKKHPRLNETWNRIETASNSGTVVYAGSTTANGWVFVCPAGQFVNLTDWSASTDSNDPLAVAIRGTTLDVLRIHQGALQIDSVSLSSSAQLNFTQVASGVGQRDFVAASASGNALHVAHLSGNNGTVVWRRFDGTTWSKPVDVITGASATGRLVIATGNGWVHFMLSEDSPSPRRVRYTACQP
ncbi:MAG: hypothetical protein KC503_39115 [Myxococcales bacterium]|nr:hypothetical protein [Myxococcales bacterium]